MLPLDWWCPGATFFFPVAGCGKWGCLLSQLLSAFLLPAVFLYLYIPALPSPHSFIQHIAPMWGRCMTGPGSGGFRPYPTWSWRVGLERRTLIYLSIFIFLCSRCVCYFFPYRCSSWSCIMLFYSLYDFIGCGR